MYWAAISGSLRAASVNTALLRAAAQLALPDVEIEMLDIGALPLFNPDVEACGVPQPVARLRERLLLAQAVLIASPEYARGVSGVLKNALDWMVGNESFVDKPVAVINASARSAHAYESLKEILATMSARLVPDACVTIPLPGNAWSPARLLADAQISTALRSILARMVEAARSDP